MISEAQPKSKGKVLIFWVGVYVVTCFPCMSERDIWQKYPNYWLDELYSYIKLFLIAGLFMLQFVTSHLINTALSSIQSLYSKQPGALFANTYWFHITRKGSQSTSVDAAWAHYQRLPATHAPPQSGSPCLCAAVMCTASVSHTPLPSCVAGYSAHLSDMCVITTVHSHEPVRANALLVRLE